MGATIKSKITSGPTKIESCKPTITQLKFMLNLKSTIRPVSANGKYEALLNERVFGSEKRAVELGRDEKHAPERGLRTLHSDATRHRTAQPSPPPPPRPSTH